MKTFSNEKALPKLSVLIWKIDLYFPEHKLATEVDGKGHEDRNIDYEIKRQKTIEKELGCDKKLIEKVVGIILILNFLYTTNNNNFFNILDIALDLIETV